MGQLIWVICPAGIVATTSVEEAVRDVDVAIMVGGFPRKAGMERKDVMSKNVSIYASQAAALERLASKDVKVSFIFISTNLPTSAPRNLHAISQLSDLCCVAACCVNFRVLVIYQWSLH